MVVALTGANGFLGWHTRAALHGQGREARAVAVGDRFDPDAARDALNGSSRAIHIAGVNRASESEIEEGNVRFASQLADAIRSVEQPPPVVVYANSTQVGNGTAYGKAKGRASDILAAAASDVGAAFADVRLPNVFGEHGQPFYNSVTATFCHLIANGQSATVEVDKSLTLLHAQDAADILIGAVEHGSQADLEVEESVVGLLGRIQAFSSTYQRGEIPDVSSDFDRDLFNTYRSFAFPGFAPIRLARHEDARGSFFEIIRSHGGRGQSSFSTTLPGITRGDHFHRRKIERFTVLSGRATISLRRLFTGDVIEFDVNGEAPAAVDMPTMWAHNIVNVGDDVLYTSFWTNDIFDPLNPDTIAEAV